MTNHNRAYHYAELMKKYAGSRDLVWYREPCSRREHTTHDRRQPLILREKILDISAADTVVTLAVCYAWTVYYFDHCNGRGLMTEVR